MVDDLSGQSSSQAPGQPNADLSADVQSLFRWRPFSGRGRRVIDPPVFGPCVPSRRCTPASASPSPLRSYASSSVLPRRFPAALRARSAGLGPPSRGARDRCPWVTVGLAAVPAEPLVGGLHVLGRLLSGRGGGVVHRVGHLHVGTPHRSVLSGASSAYAARRSRGGRLSIEAFPELGNHRARPFPCSRRAFFRCRQLPSRHCGRASRRRVSLEGGGHHGALGQQQQIVRNGGRETGAVNEPDEILAEAELVLTGLPPPPRRRLYRGPFIAPALVMVTGTSVCLGPETSVTGPRG